MDLIRIAKDVTNIIRKVPPLEGKTIAVDQMVKDIQNKIDLLDIRVEVTENVLKKIADKSYSILKGIDDNIKVLLDKLE